MPWHSCVIPRPLDEPWPPSSAELFHRQPILTEADVVLGRQAVGRAMAEVGAREVRRTRLVTAASEIFRNALRYGGGGEAVIFIDRITKAVLVECRDDGPGIEDTAVAMRDGYTSGKGLGMGLGGAQRLTDAFELHSRPNEGTRVRMMSRA